MKSTKLRIVSKLSDIDDFIEEQHIPYKMFLIKISLKETNFFSWPLALQSISEHWIQWQIIIHTYKKWNIVYNADQ